MNRNNSDAFKFGHRVPYSETDVVQNVIAIDPCTELEKFKRNSEKYRSKDQVELKENKPI
ncbi:hypothetical protein FG264_14960 [Listeria monocytogenes]|nr:hypothetical protein [Listeria monocytogenes]